MSCLVRRFGRDRSKCRAGIRLFVNIEILRLKSSARLGTRHVHVDVFGCQSKEAYAGSMACMTVETSDVDGSPYVSGTVISKRTSITMLALVELIRLGEADDAACRSEAAGCRRYVMADMHRWRGRYRVDYV
jgi:hypothetical protein